MNTKTKLSEQKVWRGMHRDIGFKIVSWGYANDGSMRDHWPSGSWNFYIYLPEKKCTNFAAIWLEDQRKSFGGSGREYISHDYYQEPLSHVDMHCGMTYYEKHGRTEGFRSVELGCDYQHYWDEGKSYNEQDVLRDAERAIDSCYEHGLLVSDGLSSAQTNRGEE